MGLGSRLLQKYENQLLELKVMGVHLQTTKYNRKALRFYDKAEFKLAYEAFIPHYKFKNLKQLIFTKNIQ
jgi:hypothetical protein